MSKIIEFFVNAWSRIFGLKKDEIQKDSIENLTRLSDTDDIGYIIFNPPKTIAEPTPEVPVVNIEKAAKKVVAKKKAPAIKKTIIKKKK